MTAKIRIIPDTLSNKIAAGEVVQRPASVVKELIENSIDAGADQITIDVKRAGKALIKVTDNGSGMTKDDALLCIERFATSKIRSESDLFNIKTLGFRGESLPSIASVSRFGLITKTSDEVEGTALYMEGGKLKSVRAAGAPTGTSISVKSLFYNTPARLKFMKSNTAELFHITDTVVKIAASRHGLHIRLISDGRIIVDFTKATDSYNRICDIFESDIYRHLIRVDEKNENIHVFGFVSNPVYTTGNTRKFFTYLNGRYIFDKLVNYAIISVYKAKIEERKYPAVVLFIEIPFDMVDVNVHPTKKDVRFKDQNYVINCIKKAITNALSSIQPLGYSGMGGGGGTSARAGSIVQAMQEYTKSAAAKPVSGYEGGRTLFSDDSFTKRPEVTFAQEPDAAAYGTGSFSDKAAAAYDPVIPMETVGEHIKVLGQVGASFIICTKGDSLLLIDQHAAHERILYDDLVQKHKEKKVSPQPLLIPIIFELSKTDAMLLQSYIDEFHAIGFTIEPFGKNSYAVKEVPDILMGYDYKAIIHDIISELMFLNKTADIKDKAAGLMKLLACKGAIKANRRLTHPEITQLLQDMSQTDFPTNCPHGRPVVIELTIKDISRMFKRL